MRKEIMDGILEEAERLDEIHYEVGDTLDVKSSIILVVVTFLGTLSGEILSRPALAGLAKAVQVSAILCLCVAGVLTLLALFPRKFDIPPDTGEMLEYADGLERHYGNFCNGAEMLLKHFQQNRIAAAMERIATNRDLANAKLKLNKAAFYVTAVAVCLELFSLALLVCPRQ